MQDDILQDLITACADKDPKALRALYEETAAYLNRVAFNILHSEEWSNDVLQDAFIQIWENAHCYRPGLSAPLTWMSSLVRYRALDKLAREKRHGGHLALETIMDTLLSMEPSVEENIEYSERQCSFLECMNTLNERARRCIQLAYLHGYSREQLATTFSTNTNTIKSWLHRSVKRLKTCLEQKCLTTS